MLQPQPNTEHRGQASRVGSFHSVSIHNPLSIHEGRLHTLHATLLGQRGRQFDEAGQCVVLLRTNPQELTQR